MDVEWWEDADFIHLAQEKTKKLGLLKRAMKLERVCSQTQLCQLRSLMTIQ